VAANVLRDRRNHEWGKWRPSAAAVRGGELAITVDRLISRDGLTVDQAYEWLRSSGIEIEYARVEAIVATFPRRCRRVMVGATLLESQVATDGMVNEACQSDARRDATRVARQLEAAIGALPAADRNLLAWRYFEGRTVAEIASALRVDQKQLYRRFQHLIEQLRRTVNLGECQTLLDALVSGDRVEIAIDFPSNEMPGTGSLRRTA
jgi:RNA polymerase sigma factor for flagellar operon FliA